MNNDKNICANPDSGLLLIRLAFGVLFFMLGFNKLMVGTAAEAEILVSNWHQSGAL